MDQTYLLPPLLVLKPRLREENPNGFRERLRGVCIASAGVASGAATAGLAPAFSVKPLAGAAWGWGSTGGVSVRGDSALDATPRS